MKRRAIIFGILTVLLLCFIWGQSLLPRDVSAGESGKVMHWLKPIFDPGGRIDDDVFHHCLRKAAHFTEYAALGLCLCGLLYSLPWKRQTLRMPCSLILCISFAAVDEFIQLFSDGRGAKMQDVLLDSAGAAVGIAVICLVFHQKRKE